MSKAKKQTPPGPMTGGRNQMPHYDGATLPAPMKPSGGIDALRKANKRKMKELDR